MKTSQIIFWLVVAYGLGSTIWNYMRAPTEAVAFGAAIGAGVAALILILIAYWVCEPFKKQKEQNSPNIQQN